MTGAPWRCAGVVALMCAVGPGSGRAQHTTAEPADSVRRELAELRSQVDSLRTLLERLRAESDRVVTTRSEVDPGGSLRAAAVAASRTGSTSRSGSASNARNTSSRSRAYPRHPATS
jgi:hypothetical protein